MTKLLLTLIILTIINLTSADTNSTGSGPFKDNELWTLFGIGFACILAAVFILLLFEKCCKYWSGNHKTRDAESDLHMDVIQ